LGPFLSCFGVNYLGRFPGAPEKLARPIRIAVPKHVRGACLDAGATRLVLETAGFVGEACDQRNRDCAFVRSFGVSVFRVWFGLFGLGQGSYGKQSKTETQRNCGEG